MADKEIPIYCEVCSGYLYMTLKGEQQPLFREHHDKTDCIVELARQITELRKELDNKVDKKYDER